MFDFLVIGGGPAGATTALCLARAGAKVAIVEASAYEQERFGETLPPEINPTLGELHLWDPFLAMAPVAAPGVLSVWGEETPVAQDFIENPHGSGWRVDRNAFDRMLLGQACEAGAVALTRVKITRPQQTNRVWTAAGVSGKILIDATGKIGLPLPGREQRQTDDGLLVIALRLAYPCDPPADARTYIETVPGGWWYSGLLPDGNLMAMFFTDKETYCEEGVVIGERLQHARLTCNRMRESQLVRSQVLYAPSFCRRVLFGEDWAVVGDAASAYDPLSGIGIWKALRHGRALAAAYVESGDLAEYSQRVHDDFAAYVRQRREHYASERRWSASGFWQRRVGATSAA